MTVTITFALRDARDASGNDIRKMLETRGFSKIGKGTWRNADTSEAEIVKVLTDFWTLVDSGGSELDQFWMLVNNPKSTT